MGRCMDWVHKCHAHLACFLVTSWISSVSSSTQLDAYGNWSIPSAACRLPISPKSWPTWSSTGSQRISFTMDMLQVWQKPSLLSTYYSQHPLTVTAVVVLTVILCEYLSTLEDEIQYIWLFVVFTLEIFKTLDSLTHSDPVGARPSALISLRDTSL